MGVKSWHLDQFSCRIGKQIIIANATMDLPVSGRAVCIVGPNGGGKSTLVKLFAGLLSARGLSLEGHAVIQADTPENEELLIDMTSGNTAKRLNSLGVEFVSQELVAPEYARWSDALIAGLEAKKLGLPRVSVTAALFDDLAKQSGLRINLKRHNRLSGRSDLQRIALLRAIFRHSKGGTFVFDEATASLPVEESVAFLKWIKSRIGSEHDGLVYVSHRNQEIELADYVVEVRSGRVISMGADYARPEQDTLLTMRAQPGPELFHVKFDNQPAVTLNAGEQKKLRLSSAAEEQRFLAALVNASAAKFDVFRLCGADARNVSVTKRRELGLRIVPIDRNRLGIFSNLTGGDNLAVGDLRSSDGVFIDRSAVHRRAERSKISTNHLRTHAKYLSGGFKQRILFARELNEQARVLVAFNPFQGVDADTTKVLSGQLEQFCVAGNAVLFVGAD